MKIPCVYIVTNRKEGVLYIGVTSSLAHRIWQHKNKVVAGFTKRYNLDKLVWYEVHGSIESAIMKEKRTKAWYRQWKINVIEELNPAWNDLYNGIL